MTTTPGPNTTKSLQPFGNRLTKRHRPFWLPASNYYVLAFAIATAMFFLVWAVLNDGGDQTPWTFAGVTASGVLAAAVFLREVILRNARYRFLESQRRLDMSLKGLSFQSGDVEHPKKLTIEKNAAILREIKQKSDAAKVLGKMPDGHKEVFEICERYLSVNRDELKNVGGGSPRLPSLLKGREIAEEFHRFHLLRWAEIEARNLTHGARSRVKTNEKIAEAQKALVVIESALAHYPDDLNLRESGDALTEFIASVKTANWIERAERAAFKGNYKQAKKLYRDALFYLDREVGDRFDTGAAAEKIHLELQRMEQLEKEGS